MTLSVEQAVATVNELMAQRRSDWTPITESASFAELALDSLDYVELFMALEEVGGFELDPSSAEGLEQVGDLANLRAV